MEVKIKNYINILKKNKQSQFCDVVNGKRFSNLNEKYVFLFLGPVIFSFITWVVEEANKKSIKKIFFLARDGYIMFKIAEQIIEKYNIPIECKYFYCSRLSLRTALFNIDYDDALNKLFSDKNRITAEVILKRLNINDKEKKAICERLKQFNLDIEQNLSTTDIINLKIRFSSDRYIKNIICERAKKEYTILADYFLQEGMCDYYTAIVDSGWTGSMQEMIKKFVESITNSKRDVFFGYYFGMYKEPSENNGVYNNFLFSPNNKFYRSRKFNNNLFECFCSANHGMTLGYKYDEDNRVTPVLKKEVLWNPTEQILAIENYTKTILNHERIHSTKNNIDMSYKLITSMMHNPSNEEANFYADILFSDDSSEQHAGNVAIKMSKSEIRSNSFLPWIKQKLETSYNNPQNLQQRKIFWIKGSLKLSEGKISFLKKQSILFLNFSKWIYSLVRLCFDKK